MYLKQYEEQETSVNFSKQKNCDENTIAASLPNRFVFAQQSRTVTENRLLQH